MEKTPKHICIAAGGTGGHLFPAQALAAHLKKKQGLYDVLFMGKGLATNAFFRKDLFSYKDVASAPLSYKNSLRNIKDLCMGTWQSFQKLRKTRPDVVVGFGSFHSFPVLLAAKLLRIPIVLFESNSIPGKVNKLFSSMAVFSAVQFPAAKKHLKGKCFTVHVPFWRFTDSETISRQEALKYFSLHPERRTLLVFGGSQGAQFINDVVIEALKEMGEKVNHLQVIHLIGKSVCQEEIQRKYRECGVIACVKAFEENMHFAWALADIAICRAGAATLSELIHFNVPSILIPYPHATDAHQLKNALFMEDLGGAVCLEEKNVSFSSLLHLIEQLLDNNNDVLQTMKTSILDFKKEKTFSSLSDLIERFVQNKEEA